ncbi:MAG: MarR family winged helix-turn-helix transcriptional regulator [Acidobacteriota bacterium]
MKSPSGRQATTTPFDPPGEHLDRRLAVGLAKIATALRHRAWREGYAADLTPTQGQVLLHLRRDPEASLAEIAEGLGVRPPTASEAVGSLVDKGLLHKGRRPDDGRILALSLTAEGRAEAERVEDWPEFLAEVLAELTPTEQRVLMSTLQRSVRLLQQRGAIPLARMCSTCTYFRPHAHGDPRRPHHCAFVDAPFGDGDLRFDCSDHQPAAPTDQSAAWQSLAVNSSQPDA